MRTIAVIAALLLAAALSAEAVKLAPRWAEKDFPGEAAIEARVQALANKERTTRKLDTLAADAALRTAARQHAAEMGKKGYFAHESPVDAWKQPWQRAYYAGYYGMAVGENIVEIQDTTLTTPDAIAARCMDLWMHSPPHRENLLKPTWTISGVGIVRVKARIYGVQLFAAPLTTIESASLERVEGELVTVTLTGTLRAGTLHTWVDSQHWAAVLPKNGAFSTAVALMRNSGEHEIAVAVGTRGVWTVRLNTDAEPNKMLATPRVIQRGVVTDVAAEVLPYRGLRLTAVARVPAGTRITVLRDDATMATPKPDADGRITLDLILPERDASYVISVAVGEVLENLLYIDTGKALKDAFLGRPE
jgi:uncharacterized protein YkwD